MEHLKTLKINVDDELLKKYNTKQLELFLRNQLKKLEEEELLNEMMQISETSLGFWDNEMDDEAWNEL